MIKNLINVQLHGGFAGKAEIKKPTMQQIHYIADMKYKILKKSDQKP